MNATGSHRLFAVPLLLLGIATLIVGGGCHPLPKSMGGMLPWTDKDKVIESQYQTPNRMVAIWTDAVYNQPGQKPTRGFGGRLYFYNEQGQATPVEGQLVVYAYDDSDANGPAQRPTRKFVFTPEQFTSHFSKTDLGASYSVWLPWDQLGGQRRTISLVPIFTATSGQVVTGAQSINMLPGPHGPEAQKQEAFVRSPAIQQLPPTNSAAGFEGAQTAYFDSATSRPVGQAAPAGSAATNATAAWNPTFDPSAQMQVATIKATPSLAQRILNQTASAEEPATFSAYPTTPSSATAVTPAVAVPPSTFSRRPGASHTPWRYTGQPATATSQRVAEPVKLPAP